MSTNERPPLRHALDQHFLFSKLSDNQAAGIIRTFSQYLQLYGLINTISQPTPRSGPRLLALLEEEAKRAEAGE